MTLIVDIVTKILAIMTVLSQLAIVLFFLYLIIFRLILKKKINLSEKVIEYFSKNSLIFIFIVTLTATSGSLFFSTIAKYTPCELCWFQRIFMYPMAIISLVALIKKQKNLYLYTLPLSIIGAMISSYHYYISFINANVITTCSATGPSCIFNYFTEFSYITFPLMAGTTFTIVIILSILSIRIDKSINNSKEIIG
jgi:disulfide bond formation protein DsbB